MPIASTLKRIAYRSLRAIADVRCCQSLRGESPNCIVVLQYMLPLGGCVHATPLFESLHDTQALPVYVATRGLGLDVLRNNPSIAGLIPTPDVFADFNGTRRALANALADRNLRPAALLTDAGNRRSRIAFLGAFASGAPLIGFNLAEDLQTATLRRDPSRSMIENNLQIAGALHADTSPREPRIYCSAADAREAADLLRELNPQDLPAAIISTQPSGGQPTAWWPERWVPVIEHLAAVGMLPIFVGTGAQSAAIDQIRSLCSPPTATAAGRTGIGPLAALLASSDLCLSIDTGTLHVARAVNLPCVALAPTFQSPMEWLPMKWPKARVLRGEGTHPAPANYHLDEIEPREVIAAIADLLRQYPATREAREERQAATITAIDHLKP